MPPAARHERPPRPRARRHGRRAGLLRADPRRARARSPCDAGSTARRPGRLQPGDDGAGRDGLPPARAALPALPRRRKTAARGRRGRARALARGCALAPRAPDRPRRVRAGAPAREAASSRAAPERGLLGGLWGVPRRAARRGRDGPSGRVAARGVEGEDRRPRASLETGARLDVRHAFSHFRVVLHAFACRDLGGRPLRRWPKWATKSPRSRSRARRERFSSASSGKLSPARNPGCHDTQTSGRRS